MKPFLHAARLALPTLFFGYALMANLSLATRADHGVPLPQGQFLSGGLTRDLDSLYKRDLPHMDLSFGLIGAARYTLLGEARHGAVVGRDGWLFSTEELRPQPSTAQLAAIVTTVSDIATQLRGAGTDLVVVPLPAKIDIYRDLGPDPVFGQALADLHQAFSRQLTDRGVAVVDARGALLNPDTPVFFATDTHWTPEGAALIAAATQASGTIAPGMFRYDRTPEPARSLTGDLVGFVTTTDLAPHIGLPRETILRAMQSQAGAVPEIFGAAEIDIVLVGTSYSANPDWGFADALMRSLGRDVIAMAQEGRGPLTPMQDYLSGPEYRDTPPRVVIWEIPIRYLTDPALWPGTSRSDPDIAALPQKENADG